MIRAVAKDRRGDVVKGPFNFEDKAQLDLFAKQKEEAYTRAGWRLEEIPASPLNDEQQGQLTLLDLLARQANGLMHHFHFDADMVRRWKNRAPTLNDIRCLRDALVAAGDQFHDLAVQEYGIKL